MTIKHLFPKAKPALNLDFANVKELDRRITFTRASIGTYVDENGTLRTAANNEARFDHDPATGESLGLLIEESRTNSVRYSEEFDNAAWVKSNSTVTPNAAAAPDGIVAADLLYPSSSGSGRGVYIVTGSTTNGTSYTSSIYAKSSGIRFISLASVRGQGVRAAWFDLQAGVIGTIVGGVTASIQKVGSGWYRCSVTDTSSGGSGLLGTVTLASADNSTSVTASGTHGVLLWGAQLEEAPFPTSYIPTTTAAVTRAADVASVTNSGIYNTNSFTILSEPFGSAAGSSTLSLVGAGGTPIKRTAVYSQNLTATEINASAGKTDEFWRWRILGSSFGLPSFQTNGQVTVDWGDGTVETLTTSDHTFTDGDGYHEIGFRMDSGTSFMPQIYDDANHKTKVVALGPAPESMVVNGLRGFWGCSNLESFDATVNATGGSDFNRAWNGCTSLASFPLIDTSSGTIFSFAWSSCTSLTSFPLIDTSSGTNFQSAWSGCTSLTSFPEIDTSSGTDFPQSWSNCTSLTSFPLINTAAGTNFYQAWNGCSGLTSFPLIDARLGTNFREAWRYCTSLTTFPANFFDSWTGTPVANCFSNTWDVCPALTATSVENILNSIDTSGQSAPASGVDITIDYKASSGTPSIATAVTNLKARGWTITLNGVAQ